MLKEMGEFPLNQILSTYAVTPITLLQNPFHVRNTKPTGPYQKPIKNFQNSYKKDETKFAKKADADDDFEMAIDNKVKRVQTREHNKFSTEQEEEEETAPAEKAAEEVQGQVEETKSQPAAAPLSKA